MKNNTWNKLLELKKLPFGSVHCIKDQDLEQEVSDIIVDVLQNDCMNDDEIHDKFTKEYKAWIMKTTSNQVIGLEKFQGLAFSNGTTEAFDKFYLKNRNRRLRYFRGEYMYHSIAAKLYFDQSVCIEDEPIQENDVVIFSLPFAGTGNEHVMTDSVLETCEALKVPVLIDCCYFGVCGGINFDFSYECITDITFSLSKNFPVQHLRIGMRLTKEDNDDALYVYNKNKYVNRLSAAVGLKLLQRYTADYNYQKYRAVQEKFCEILKVEMSKCVFFATSTESFEEYNRGIKENRLCFSKYLKSEMLPHNFYDKS
jgi:hypothetical protein